MATTAKPVILAVDDDPQVLGAVVRDLRRHYAREHRVLRADSGDAALAVLDELATREVPVALFVVDQRMPGMSGVSFLTRALDRHPDARRVLLTAYADTDAAIRAINEVAIDHYLLKPWDPPDEKLYPVLDDLLADWRAGYRPTFTGVRIVGHRWSPISFQLKDFLARHQVPYRWLNVETDDRAQDLLSTDDGDPKLPVVILEDGSRLEAPSVETLADKLGLRRRAAASHYDLVIVGGGPAGLAAAVYGASEGLRTVLVEREAPGGQAGMSSRIENYLGFPVGLSGADLARRAVVQARRFGVEILAPQQAAGLEINDPYRRVLLADDDAIQGHSILLATGVQWRPLDVPGAKRLTGAGVYYGAGMTEAMECEGEDVYIVGGANSAGQAAMYFARHARTVVMLVRGPSLEAKMSQYLVDQIAATKNIRVDLDTWITEAHGDTSLDALTLASRTRDAPWRIEATSVFVFIGAVPDTAWLDGAVARDDHGFVFAGPTAARAPADGPAWPLDRDPYLLETNVPGIFAVGDVRSGSVKRVASSVGEGSVAVQFVHRHLAEIGA